MFIRKATTVTAECPKCGYKWTPRIDPQMIKSCPECKQRIGKYFRAKEGVKP